MNLAACEVRKVARLDSSLGLRFWSLYLGETNPTLIRRKCKNIPSLRGIHSLA